MVERLFALLKKWLFLRYEHSINFSPLKVHEIFVIICGFHNAFGCSLYLDETQQIEDAERIINGETEKNDVELKESKTTNGWRGQKIADLMDMEDEGIIPDFDVAAIRRLAGGPYQMHLAIPYYRHSKDQNLKFMVHSKHPHSIKTMGIVSRHSRNNDDGVTRYQIYHRFDKDGDFSKTLSFCTCNVGMGTNCLCAHAAASLYILRHKLDGTEIPPQHPRTDKHFGGMIDLYYYKLDRVEAAESDDGGGGGGVDGDGDGDGVDSDGAAMAVDISDVELDVELERESESESKSDIELDIESVSECDSGPDGYDSESVHSSDMGQWERDGYMLNGVQGSESSDDLEESVSEHPSDDGVLDGSGDDIDEHMRNVQGIDRIHDNHNRKH